MSDVWYYPQTSAWATTITILQSDAEPDVKLFAATTLRGKVSLPDRPICSPSPPSRSCLTDIGLWVT
jgi:hypothetical protein